MASSRRHAGKPRRKRGAHRSERGASVSTNVPAERASVSSRRRRRSGGTMTLDTQSLTSLSNEARQAVTAAFDALVHWRNEIFAANERCLTQVLDRVTDAHRALGWPEQVTVAAKEHFLKASKMQSYMIEQAMDVWQQQLKPQNARTGVPGFIFQTPAPSQFTMPVSEMMRFGEMTLAPFKLWIEVCRDLAAQLDGRNVGGSLAGTFIDDQSSVLARLEVSTRRKHTEQVVDRPCGTSAGWLEPGCRDRVPNALGMAVGQRLSVLPRGHRRHIVLSGRTTPSTVSGKQPVHVSCCDA